METPRNLREETGKNGGTAKPKWTFGHVIMEFLVNGGIILLVVLIAALALAINLLLVRWKLL